MSVVSTTRDFWRPSLKCTECTEVLNLFRPFNTLRFSPFSLLSLLPSLPSPFLLQVSDAGNMKVSPRMSTAIRPKAQPPPVPSIKIDKVEPFLGGFKYTLDSSVSTNQPRTEDAITYINKGGGVRPRMLLLLLTSRNLLLK